MVNENFFSNVGIYDSEQVTKEMEFITKLGLTKITPNNYIVFSNKGEFIKVVDIVKDFKQSDKLMAEYLECNKLYTVSLVCFHGRPIDWYDMQLNEQLTALEWEFNNQGELINTAW